MGAEGQGYGGGDVSTSTHLNPRLLAPGPSWEEGSGGVRVSGVGAGGPERRRDWRSRGRWLRDQEYVGAF